MKTFLWVLERVVDPLCRRGKQAQDEKESDWQSRQKRHSWVEKTACTKTRRCEGDSRLEQGHIDLRGRTRGVWRDWRKTG